MPEVEHPKRFISGTSFEDAITFADADHVVGCIDKNGEIEEIKVNRPTVPNFGIIPILGSLRRLSFSIKSLVPAFQEMEWIRSGEVPKTISPSSVLWVMFIWISLQMIVLPHVTIHTLFWLLSYQTTPQLFNMATGGACVLFFLWVMIKFKDWRRETAFYHGAEHMCAQVYEAGKPLTVEEAKKFSPYHPRCGTSLVTLFMIVLPFSFYLVPVIGIKGILLKMVLFVLLFGLTCDLFILINLHAPFLLFLGTWMQRFTVSYPEEKHLKLALQALNLLHRYRRRDASQER